MQYEEATIDLHAGDVLVMFTDGVTEALSLDGEEFGEARLQSLLHDVAALPVEEISSRLSEELRAWTTGAAQHDDLTFILMKVKGP
jgi:sigma-B regulation protein RsbU (phosphoserine phosphatase)